MLLSWEEFKVCTTCSKANVLVMANLCSQTPNIIPGLLNHFDDCPDTGKLSTGYSFSFLSSINGLCIVNSSLELLIPKVHDITRYRWITQDFSQEV